MAFDVYNKGVRCTMLDLIWQNPIDMCAPLFLQVNESNALVWFHIWFHDAWPFPKEESSRLSTGALIRQEELVGERLKYTRLSGTGPSTGWVSLKVKDKPTLGQKNAASFARGGIFLWFVEG